MTKITVREKNAPKQEGWSWTLKTDELGLVGVNDKLVGEIEVGGVYDVDITTKEKGGKTYKDIARINGRLSAAVQIVNDDGVRYAGRYGATDDATAERIFVCGLVNNLAPKAFERDGGLTHSKLVDLVNMARATWRETLGAKP